MIYCKCKMPDIGKMNCKKCGYEINNTPSIEELRAELKKCINPERIKELKKILDFFDYGIK